MSPLLFIAFSLLVEIQLLAGDTFSPKFRAETILTLSAFHIAIPVTADPNYLFVSCC